MESSFLGGTSVDFGLTQPLKIFDEPEPTTIDYFKPTADSVSNFIKNIVLAAKMEREIPIMAAAYLESFTQKVKLQLTSINYKRYFCLYPESWYACCCWPQKSGTTSPSKPPPSPKPSPSTPPSCSTKCRSKSSKLWTISSKSTNENIRTSTSRCAATLKKMCGAFRPGNCL